MRVCLFLSHIYHPIARVMTKLIIFFTFYFFCADLFRCQADTCVRILLWKKMLVWERVRTKHGKCRDDGCYRANFVSFLMFAFPSHSLVIILYIIPFQRSFTPPNIAKLVFAFAIPTTLVYFAIVGENVSNDVLFVSRFIYLSESSWRQSSITHVEINVSEYKHINAKFISERMLLIGSSR